MKIRNVDPTGADREIPDAGEFVKNGSTVEVDDELGERLIEQENVWKQVGSRKHDDEGDDS